MTRSIQHAYRHALRRQPITPLRALNGNIRVLTSQYHTYNCRHALKNTSSSSTHFAPRTTAIPPFISSFSTSSALLKKKDKKGNDSPKSAPSAGGGTGAADATEDPFNFSTLQDGITDAVAKLKDELSKLRAGGRFNPETIEGLKVTVPKGGGGGKESLRLGSLAQVIPKGGRAVMVLVGEEEHIKHVTTTIQSSNFTPQADPHNPLQLIVPIPPPTQESRDKSVQDARAAMDKAANVVKNARAAQQKRLREMKLKKTVRPDDLKKASDQMEKVVEKGQKEVKDVFEGVKKALEQR